MVDLGSALLTVVKTGKVVFGLKETFSEVERGRVKMVVLASNCPQIKFDKLIQKSNMSNIPVYIYPGSGFDLGVDCGKPFSVLSIAIRETGDSEILKLMEE